jgi:cytosine/adenosine deaminase-related metal-dependent hydrolase
MNNGVGAADVEGLLNKGVRLCLGNDGFTQDMWAEWKAAYLMHKLWHRDPRKMNGMDIAAMAIENNAALISSFFDNQIIGEIKMGAAADLILVDYQQFTELNIDNLAWHILFGFQESMVTMTMVSGQVLMKDRELLTLDEERISIEALKIAPQVWARYEANVING